MGRMGPLGSRVPPPSRLWCSTARPLHHPADSSRRSHWTRLDPMRPTAHPPPEQARSVWSRPDRRGSPAYGSGDEAMAVPADAAPCGHVPSRTLGGSGRCWCRLSSGALPLCPHDPAAVAGVRSAGHPRAAGVHQPRPRSTPLDRRCPPAAPTWPATPAGVHGAGHCGRVRGVAGSAAGCWPDGRRSACDPVLEAPASAPTAGASVPAGALELR